MVLGARSRLLSTAHATTGRIRNRRHGEWGLWAHTVGAPEALRLVESCYPLGYCAANTRPPVFSNPATKAPVAAFSMR
jgi:hypothetical protein